MNTDRTLGMTIIGQTGFGKSAFLHNLVMEDIQEGRSSIIIDPHGDLATDILESVDADHAKNVYVLEVNEEQVFGLNLYECENRKSQLAIDRTVDNSILVFKRLMHEEAGFHPHIEFLLRNTAYTILNNPTLTMAEVSLMFAQSELGKVFRSNLLKQIDDIDLHNFWQGVEDRKGNLAYQYIEPLLNKVSPFTASRVMRMIVGQEHTTLPFSEFLDQPGKTLIVNLPIGVIGEEKTQMLGMTFLSLLSEHIYERVNQRKARRVPIHLYIDEAGLFFSSGTAISKLLKQGRKFGLGTHLSFQTLSDLPDKEAQSAVLQVGSLVLFQVIGGTDAEILSKQLQVKQPPVETVPKMRMEPNLKKWTEWVWIDEEKKQWYEESERLLERIPQAKHTARDTIEKLVEYIGEGFNDIRTVGGVHYDRADLDRLLAGKPPQYDKERVWDELFVPRREYLKGKVKTRSGLVKLGEKVVYDINDIYSEEAIAYFKKNRSYRKEGFGIFSRLVPYRDAETDKTDIPDFLLEGGTLTVYEEKYLFSPEAIENILLVQRLKVNLPGMYDELVALLRPIYARKLWTFIPHTSPGGTSSSTAWGNVVLWIKQTPPPAIGAERESSYWSAWGIWNTSHRFPEAVAWLQEKARFLLEKEQGEGRFIALQTEDREKFERKRQQVYEQFYVSVERQEQDGWIPVKTEEIRALTQRPNYSRHGPSYFEGSILIEKEHQIYDMVDGSPRMFSDLWNEMQANLATLPPYHYYMQTINEQKEITESQQRSAAPPHAQPYGQEQAEEIRARSLLYFGTPAEQVRKELQERIAPFLGGSDDNKPESDKNGAKPKPKPKPDSGISGAKPYP